MNAPHRTLLFLLIVAGLGGTLLASPAFAGTFQWTNPGGGLWEDGNNWNQPGYPRFLWDFAVFNLEDSYGIDASNAAMIQSVGGVMINAGDVSLIAHDTFGAILAVGTAGSPASMTLRNGAVDAAGTHTVGPQGVLVLGADAKLVSRTTSSVGFAIESGGTLRGDGGSLESHVLRSFGTVSPGLAPGTPGLIRIGAQSPAGYTQRETGTLEIEIAGLAPGTEHDQLRVESAIADVVLDGTLTVSLINGYVPNSGDRFDIITAPAISGTFAVESLPSVPGFEFSLVYEPDKVSVVATGSAPAASYALDIRPASCPNPLNISARGVLPVAVLGSLDADVHEIDISTLRLEGATPVKWVFRDVAAPYAGEPCECSEDGPDGFEDLFIKFYVSDVIATIPPTVENREQRVLTLTGALLSGAPFEASDCVVLHGVPAHESAGRGHGKRFRITPIGLPNAPSQQVSYLLPEAADVTLAVYTITGRKVAEVVQAAQPAGVHTAEWHAADVPSGIYVYRLKAGGWAESQKLMLFK